MHDYNEVFLFSGTPICSPGLASDTDDCLVVKGWLIPRDDQRYAAVLPFPAPACAPVAIMDARWRQAS